MELFERFQHCREVMESRGYSLHSHNAARTQAEYAKVADRSGISINATVKIGIHNETVELCYMTGFFMFTTTPFDFHHDRFKDLFEEKILKGARALRMAFPEQF